MPQDLAQETSLPRVDPATDAVPYTPRPARFPSAEQPPLSPDGRFSWSGSQWVPFAGNTSPPSPPSVARQGTSLPGIGIGILKWAGGALLGLFGLVAITAGAGHGDAPAFVMGLVTALAGGLLVAKSVRTKLPMFRSPSHWIQAIGWSGIVLVVMFGAGMSKPSTFQTASSPHAPTAQTGVTPRSGATDTASPNLTQVPKVVVTLAPTAVPTPESTALPTRKPTATPMPTPFPTPMKCVSVPCLMTKDSGLYGILVPTDAVPKSGSAPDTNPGEVSTAELLTNVGTVKAAVAFYQAWMPSKGWTAASGSIPDPSQASSAYRSEFGYTASLNWCKPTDPITSVFVQITSQNGQSQSTQLDMMIIDDPGETTCP